MDETVVWAEMLSDTTVNAKGAKTITMKSTGHENVRVTVCLTATADGRKLKPMIVFKGAKRESILLNQEFKGRCFIASSTNGWMNEDLTINFVKNVVGWFAFVENTCVEAQEHDAHAIGVFFNFFFG